MKDALLIQTKKFPAAGSTASTTAFDFGSATGVVPGDVQIEVSHPAMTEVVADKKITYTVEDSADNSTFVTLGISKVVTGTTGTGGVAAMAARWRLPKTTRRYVRVSAAEETGGGDITAYDFTASIVT